MIVFIALWAAASNWLAYKKGFYQLQKKTDRNPLLVTNRQLFTTFGLYIILAMFVAPIFARFILWTVHSANPEITSLPIAFITTLQFAVMGMIFLLLLAFIKNQDPALFRKIWKDKNTPSSAPISFDFGLGFATWFLSFPIVSVVSDVMDKIIQWLFGLQYYEQAAVQFVKVAQSSFLSLVFALLSILIMAPLIEEFLFRGILQTYFKKRLGTKAAILLSSLCFALFHFSPSQGLGNISLILSLFILGGFLGFLYERQGSLWASIGLHVTFNTISAMRIIIFPEVL